MVFRRSNVVPPAWLIAALLAAAYLVVNPLTADLAAQTYRTWLFQHAGFALWDNGWYGGHHVPAYSILFPPLAAWTSPELVGVVSALVAAWGFEHLAAPLPGGRVAAAWFATATAVSLFTGRLTFALGLALGVLAVLALARGRLRWAAALGVATALGSPVAAAFLALPLVAWTVTRKRWASGGALLAATLVPAVALSAMFPEGGDFPFTASAFWPTLGATLLVLAVTWRSAAPAVRIGLSLYAVLLAVSGVLSTPMGGNAVRLGAVFAGPIAAVTLWPDRRRAFLLLVVPLLYWQLSSPVDDVRRAEADPSTHASFYVGLLGFLGARQDAEGPLRVEIPFTDNHWESARVAPTVALARGWERQLDRKVNPLFYDGRPLTAARYERWLHARAVSYVALANAPIDYSAAAEAALVRRPQPFLREVWHDAHWRVFRVAGTKPLATGARVTKLGPNAITLDVPRAGRVLLRVRYTPYWRLAAGSGCVRRQGPWTVIEDAAPGRLTLTTHFSLLHRAKTVAVRCTPATTVG